MDIKNAVRAVRALSVANFNESIDIVINTTLDPRKQNQMLRSNCILPSGTGKTIKIAVL